MHIGWEGNSPLTPIALLFLTTGVELQSLVFEGLHPWNWKYQLVFKLTKCI